jgi:hypothetical protein
MKKNMKSLADPQKGYIVQRPAAEAKFSEGTIGRRHQSQRPFSDPKIGRRKGSDDAVMELMDHRSVLSPERKCLDRIYVDCFSDALFAIWTEIPFSSHTVLPIPASSLHRSGIAISSFAEQYRQSRWPQVGLFRVADDLSIPQSRHNRHGKQ